MGVPRYTTPVITLTFTEKDLDLTQASSVYVTFKQAGKTVTVEDPAVTEKTISVSFTQEQTAQFCEGEVEVQANWMIAGSRVASEVATYEFTEQLLQRVIE